MFGTLRCAVKIEGARNSKNEVVPGLSENGKADDAMSKYEVITATLHNQAFLVFGDPSGCGRLRVANRGGHLPEPA
jgi:hypothetical protein